jgi:hypothetical protein
LSAVVSPWNTECYSLHSRRETEVLQPVQLDSMQQGH